ncbi:MAG: AAA family ATPase [Verrucomicrobiae bacterium]|nr:AAA family ATPase [Verrucomicrobiae bacterium]
MLTGIRIENFRCFRQLSIEPLKRVNLITGQNNTGKTCLLEALTLLLDHAGGFSEAQARFQQLSSLFRPHAQGFWPWLFYQKKAQDQCKFVAALDGVEHQAWLTPDSPPQALAASYPSPESYPIGPLVLTRERAQKRWPAVTVLTTPIFDPAQTAKDFNQLVLKRRSKQVEALLKEIEPRLISLQLLLDPQNQPVIFAELDLPEMIPITQMGLGFCRLLHIYTRILAADAQVVLIDEIENGIHHAILPVVWKGLADLAARMNVQIFATTHSWECVVAAHEAFAETRDYDFALHRLERMKDDIQAFTYDREALEAALKSALEVR